MIEGVKIEDWNFIFETQDPEYDRKLNRIIDLYFENKRTEIQKIKNPLSKLRKMRQLHYYKTHVRRQERLDEAWLTEIPTYGLYKRQIPITKAGKKILIKDQIEPFASMLELIGALYDLEEFLEANRIRTKAEKSYYFTKLYLTAYSVQIKRRESKGWGKRKKEMLYGSEPSAEEEILKDFNKQLDEGLIKIMTGERR